MTRRGTKEASAVRRKWAIKIRRVFRHSIWVSSTIFIIIAAYGTLLAFPEPLFAHQASQSPKRVVRLSIKAMGGKEVNRIHSVRALADCIGPPSRYQTEIWSGRGNRLMFKQTWDDGRRFLGYVNGNFVWTREERHGDLKLGDQQLAAMLRGHEFQMIAISPLERYPDAVTEGYEDFAGALCVKLRTVDELGKTCFQFFNVRSNLMAGLIVRDALSETNEVRIVFKEWGLIDRVILPSRVTATNRNGDFIFSFREITLNRIDERIFSVPSKILAEGGRARV
jgi:hypothetical protein